ncbi:ACP S-malonyltransferase [Bacillus inaquosorum]|uniref:ACP S-malonyltransferase n=1 Tax=Bacillus inaquosorum TaxID=483913 RepID=UPI000745E209|nr:MULTISPECIES: ACP S-malonyltransferase [Bacillus subtilis group]AMA52846.1 malonyl CoA-ACP transacylase [Bacillus inaquosorum]MBT2193486.1 ACP S-malonyltransferase [Bacillus inaquosorum]MBT3120240.1 ACP S-malonyltransferase [Bacillus inaquosorum]MBT3124561.1 ACP S-malonyltransferase [Bacillus inaquosorum]MCY8377392.1 ACP S-malonyltransferase [Bacillus inaquosorum]
MTVYVFPGQGSQKKGMGEGLFTEFPHLTKQADDILGYSIQTLCLENPEESLGKTQYTQPALFVVNAFHYLKRIKEANEKPDYLAGHSLGEYNALFAAGVFDFETGLKLVKKRGELMSQCYGGGMAAVVGLNEQQIAEVLALNGLAQLDIANYNSPTQMVLSGSQEDITRAKGIFEQTPNVQLFVPLNTSGAFHSRYMQKVKSEFSDYLDEFSFFAPAIPIISNVEARPYGENIKDNLIAQIDHPVKWTESIRYLMGKGETDYLELGPGHVLTNLVNQIKRKASPLIVEDKPTLVIEEIEKTAEKAPSPDIPSRLTASSLGSDSFKKDYNLKYAYLTGGMYRGISSTSLVVRVGKEGMMGFFGSGGLKLTEIEQAIVTIQKELYQGEPYGFNLVHQFNHPQREEEIVNLFLKNGVNVIEASAFLGMTPALIIYRAKGLKPSADGSIGCHNRIIAKISRPEVAEAFLSPAPERLLNKLEMEGGITSQEAKWLRQVPMADDITVEADSGGHTDSGVSYALLPTIIRLRDRLVEKYAYKKEIRIGAAGGIGTPEAAAAAFTLGAAYILTGSVNQCTVEANTSDAVKDLLQQMNVQDTDYAPAGDLFELGSKIQVLKKGVFFPARANKLWELYRHYESWEAIDEKTRHHIEELYFKCPYEEVYAKVKLHYSPEELQKIENNPKHKMAAIFKWYFHYSNQLALSGNPEFKVDYQIHCGPALGSFNEWVKGTELENWRNRHADHIGKYLMDETAQLLTERFQQLLPVKESLAYQTIT